MVVIQRLASALAILGLVAAMGCQQKGGDAAPEAAEAPAPAAAEAAAPEAEAAPAAEAAAAGDRAITGTVSFEGDAPVMPKLKREADPVCAKTEMTSEKVMVKDGKLKNVVVTLAGALPAKKASGALVVDQKECMYAPRVQCLQAGQKMQIKNSDNTMHNVHTYEGMDKGKTLWNRAQVPNGPDMTQTIKKAGKEGTVAYFTCDVHPWMEGFVYVTENGFCEVTGEDGTFKFEGLAAGEYTVTFWHEEYGTKISTITVAADADATADIAFSAADKG